MLSLGTPLAWDLPSLLSLPPHLYSKYAFPSTILRLSESSSILNYQWFLLVSPSNSLFFVSSSLPICVGYSSKSLQILSWQNCKVLFWLYCTAPLLGWPLWISLLALLILCEPFLRERPMSSFLHPGHFRGGSGQLITGSSHRVSCLAFLQQHKTPPSCFLKPSLPLLSKMYPFFPFPTPIRTDFPHSATCGIWCHLMAFCHLKPRLLRKTFLMPWLQLKVISSGEILFFLPSCNT